MFLIILAKDTFECPFPIFQPIIPFRGPITPLDFSLFTISSSFDVYCLTNNCVFHCPLPLLIFLISRFPQSMSAFLKVIVFVLFLKLLALRTEKGDDKPTSSSSFTALENVSFQRSRSPFKTQWHNYLLTDPHLFLVFQLPNTASFTSLFSKLFGIRP